MIKSSFILFVLLILFLISLSLDIYWLVWAVQGNAKINSECKGCDRYNFPYYNCENNTILECQNCTTCIIFAVPNEGICGNFSCKLTYNISVPIIFLVLLGVLFPIYCAFVYKYCCLRKPALSFSQNEFFQNLQEEKKHVYSNQNNSSEEVAN